ncbi:hypothetical protein [Halorubrum sp. 48-1-W]|nr:hypothetical protein [Halorubrum sp. 48-1-W]
MTAIALETWPWWTGVRPVMTFLLGTIALVVLDRWYMEATR